MHIYGCTCSGFSKFQFWKSNKGNWKGEGKVRMRNALHMFVYTLQKKPETKALASNKTLAQWFYQKIMRLGTNTHIEYIF